MASAMIGFLGDLHLGNLFSDVDGVLDLVRSMMLMSGDGRLDLVFVGDLIEGAHKYRTQIYKMFNVEPLRVQLDLFQWFMQTINAMAKERNIKVKIYVVLGNHDLGYDYGNLLKFVKTKNMNISYDTLLLRTKYHKILVKHQLNRGSRGSYLTWWSGYLLNLAQKLLSETGADMLVTAHTHRPDISIVNRDNKFYVGLPAYIVSNEDHKYNKAILYNDGWIRILIQDKNQRNQVLRNNIKRMSELVGVEPLIDEISV